MNDFDEDITDDEIKEYEEKAMKKEQKRQFIESFGDDN
jgi:hypothetical protein